MVENNIYTIEYCNKTINEEWDKFVSENDGDIAQTSAWADYEMRFKGQTSKRFLIKEGNEIVAGCQIKIINYRFIGSIGNINRGPCVKRNTPEIHKLIVEGIKKITKEQKLLYTVISPNYYEDEFASFLSIKTFYKKPIEIPPYSNRYLKSTLLIDLSSSVEDLFDQMKKGRKKCIRKGLKSPIEVVVGGRDDLETFYELVLATNKRFNTTNPLVTSLEDVHTQWDLLSPNKWITLHLGKVNGEIICASLTYSFGKTFRNYHWGWNGEYSEYNVSDVIDWNTIQWAKENGFKYYDFVQVDYESAQVIQSGEPIPDSIKQRELFGATYYKMQFGGFLKNYPDSYVYYPNKLKYFLVHIFGNYCIIMMSKIKRKKSKN